MNLHFEVVKVSVMDLQSDRIQVRWWKDRAGMEGWRERTWGRRDFEGETEGKCKGRG